MLLSLELVVSLAYENSQTRFLETVKDFHLMGISLYRKRYFTLFGGEHPQLKSGDPMKETA